MTTPVPIEAIDQFTWKHVLYRFFDRDDRLLYVGITLSLGRRFSAHAKNQPWWDEVANCRVEFHPDRSTLEAAEKETIQRERPRYNAMHNSEVLRRRKREADLAHLGATPLDRILRLTADIAAIEADVREARLFRAEDLRELAAEVGLTRAARLANLSVSLVKQVQRRPAAGSR